MAEQSAPGSTAVVALIAAAASVAGSFIGVRVASVQGDKAIELETKKFELALIKDALANNDSREDALNQLTFLVRMGLIETVDEATVNELTLDNLPSFRPTRSAVAPASVVVSQGGQDRALAEVELANAGESLAAGQLADPTALFPAPNPRPWNAVEAWGRLNSAAAVWDVQTAADALAILQNEAMLADLPEFVAPCVQRYAQDVQSQLEARGGDGFALMSAVKEYYNQRGGCGLDAAGDFLIAGFDPQLPAADLPTMGELSSEVQGAVSAPVPPNLDNIPPFQAD